MGLEFASGKGATTAFGKGYFGDGKGNIRPIGGIFYADGKGNATKIYESVLHFKNFHQVWTKTGVSTVTDIVANDNGDLYARTSSNTASKIDPETGNIIWNYSVDGYGFMGLTADSINNLGVDPKGDLLIAANAAIYTVDPTGKKIAKIGKTDWLGNIADEVNAVGSDNQGNIYWVRGGDNPEFHKSNINLKDIWVTSGGRGDPNKLVFDSQGNIYYADDSLFFPIDKYNSNGNEAWSTQRLETSNVDTRMYGFDLDSKGNLFAAHGKYGANRDSLQGLNLNLTKFDINGQLLWTKEIGDYQGLGLVVDAADNILVYEFQSSDHTPSTSAPLVLEMYDNSGDFIASTTVSPAENGSYVVNFCVTDDGAVYLTNADGTEIIKYQEY